MTCCNCVTGHSSAELENISATCGPVGELPARYATTPEFDFEPLIQAHANPVCRDWVRLDALSDLLEVEDIGKGRQILHVPSSVLTGVTAEAYRLCNHFLSEETVKQFVNAYEDPCASDNDRFVLGALLENILVSARGELPLCQDTGTAIVHGHKGQTVWTAGDDEEAISRGVYEAYGRLNLRFSQNAPLDMFQEVNTKTNLPAQIEVEAERGDEYAFTYICKGGGSANKTTLYQKTKALLNPAALRDFVGDALRAIGTAACPPYHLALVVGGTSAEHNLLMGKLASIRDLDGLPTTGARTGRAFRDLEYEKVVMEIAQNSGIGAQFGGKYFAVDARVIRLPRHGASCPVSVTVSCAADRQVRARINKDGVFIEKLCTEPSRLIPAALVAANALSEAGAEAPAPASIEGVLRVDLDEGMASTLKQLHAAGGAGARVLLNGHIVVARDIAHARLGELLDKEGDLPQVFKDHPIYYAGPARTPKGYASGSMGPTTAQRMDPYVGRFNEVGASLVTIAKGNRGACVSEACARNHGFYLGSIGGPAALLAERNIKEVECVMWPELGMEAVYFMKVVDFPAVIICDDTGKDIYTTLLAKK